MLRNGGRGGGFDEDERKELSVPVTERLMAALVERGRFDWNSFARRWLGIADRDRFRGELRVGGPMGGWGLWIGRGDGVAAETIQMGCAKKLRMLICEEDLSE